MNELSTAFAVLSAMITPAVLISACSSLILATSQRLNRVIERARSLIGQVEELARQSVDGEELHARRLFCFRQLGRAARRARYLQRAMISLYLALGIFVATSVAIAIAALINLAYAWIPIMLGLVGISLLLMASLFLIAESRVALAAVDDEMDWAARISRRLAPPEVL